MTSTLIQKEYNQWSSGKRIFSRTISPLTKKQIGMNSSIEVPKKTTWIPAKPLIPRPPQVPGMLLVPANVKTSVQTSKPSNEYIQKFPILTSMVQYKQVPTRPQGNVVQYQNILPDPNTHYQNIIQYQQVLTKPDIILPKEQIMQGQSNDPLAMAAYAMIPTESPSVDSDIYYTAIQTDIKSKTSEILSQPAPTIQLYGYDIVKILGAGAFGTVACVRRRDTNEEYVVKLLPKRTVSRIVYKNEINMLQRIQSSCTEYLLCYMGTDETAEFYIIFLEYLADYVTLQDLLTQIRINNKGLTSVAPFVYEQEDLLLVIVGRLMLGLKQLHSVGIAHRDIKADNIMVSPIGQIKFIDFGLACDSLTCPMQFISGTITYLAPELLVRRSPPSLEEWQIADFWALGMVIYHIANLTSFSDEIFIKLRSVPFMFDVNYKHAVAYIMGTTSSGDLNWMKTLKWNNSSIISILTALLQVDPSQRYLPDINLAHSQT